MVLSGFEPKALWEHFEKITSIPHCSGNEEQLADHLLSYARDKNLEADKDKNGNVVIRIPATKGHEKAPTVVLQGHMDMVCEKNSDVDHDFSKDALDLEVKEGWVTAKGTTLGADNGIGLAAALTFAEENEYVHGPLEILCTVDEEVGLTGAGKLEAGFVKGKIMLNLDSEEIGEVYIGCAGGGDSVIKLPLTFTDAPAGTKRFLLKVTGLRGGHSGIDISEQRGNALKILTRILLRLVRTQPCHLAGINGGNKRNAIAREAEAELYVLDTAVDEVKEIIGEEKEYISAELGGREHDLAIGLEPAGEKAQKVMDAGTQMKALNLLEGIPHGVHAMSYDIENLVETSNNLATVGTSENEMVICTSTRSSISSALGALRETIRSISELAGAQIDIEEAYPGWKPNLDSNLLAVVKKVHKEQFGKEPEMKAIHAGLECGIIGEKFPGMDMISIGPWIEHPHSPEERVNIESVGTFWKLLTAVLEELA